MRPRLAVVIVNYRTPALVVDCLRSLEAEVAGIEGTQVVVVDNLSGDGSVEQIGGAITSEGWGGWASVQAAPRNAGFAAGNNAALRPLLASPEPPDWFLLLNPDTYVRPGALLALLEATTNRPDAGILGSRLEEPDGTPQPSAFRFHGILAEFERELRLRLVARALSPWTTVLAIPADARKVDWVSGASMLVRREVFEQVGLLDEGYFLYYEEVDLCLRAARAGWACWYEPRSRVVHLVGRSTGVDPSDASRAIPPYVLQSRHRYFVKNFGLARALLADLAWLAGHLLRRARMRLLGRPRGSAPGLLRAFLRESTLGRGGLP
ncbi:MAG: glycosyltransferase family 2 protein [Deltaproteobacteria bacterium]|nr:glycosyltransferase family 2 protein [Deltaproteobacteria bacterium]